MFSRIEALKYRSLRHVDQQLESFHVLVGPNASGKSTFLDVVAFLGDLLRVGPTGAILGDQRIGLPERAPDPGQLVWMRHGDRFELAVELSIPTDRKAALASTLARCRYEIAIGRRTREGQVQIQAETLWLLPANGQSAAPQQRELFPDSPDPPSQIVHTKKPAGWRRVVNKVESSGNDYFASETTPWNNFFRIGPTRSALANLPEDEAKFPVATWVRRVLLEGVQRIVLNSEAMRQPSAPGRAKTFLPDGSNLPWVVDGLRRRDRRGFLDWIKQLKIAFPDLESVAARERKEDRRKYLMLNYRNGLEAPSWLVSDGTLRLLALTLLPYAAQLGSVYLVEEPENGIHPRAVESVFESLSSVRDAQVLCATHSPIMLGLAKPEQILCFARDECGATDIVRGDAHPKLRKWRGETDLGTLFASGVLG
jgi:putative AbiEii toxin of type IV toxin-antitoxin system